MVLYGQGRLSRGLHTYLQSIWFLAGSVFICLSALNTTVICALISLKRLYGKEWVDYSVHVSLAADD